MEEKLLLKNNLGSIIFRASMLILGIIITLIGILGNQNYKWIPILNGIGFLVIFIISSSRNYYILLNNFYLTYKKSFFHKVIKVETNSISGIEYSSKYIIIDTINIQFKISVADVREYDYINTLPIIIQELKIISDKNKMLVN